VAVDNATSAVQTAIKTALNLMTEFLDLLQKAPKAQIVVRDTSGAVTRPLRECRWPFGVVPAAADSILAYLQSSGIAPSCFQAL